MNPCSKLATLVLLAVPTMLTGGCVTLGEHEKLKDQFASQESYVKRHKEAMKQTNREATRLAMSVRSKELEIDRLNNENKELSHQLQQAKKAATAKPVALAKATPAPSQPASFSFADNDVTVNTKTKGIVLDQAVLFAPGSARLKAGGKTILGRLARKLNGESYRRYKIRVEGHTDHTPITRAKKVIKDNWQLSGMRARAVLNELEKQGVAPERLCFAGYSFHKPIASGRSKKAQARNRRVELILFDA